MNIFEKKFSLMPGEDKLEKDPSILENANKRIREKDGQEAIESAEKDIELQETKDERDRKFIELFELYKSDDDSDDLYDRLISACKNSDKGEENLERAKNQILEFEIMPEKKDWTKENKKFDFRDTVERYITLFS